MERLLKQRTRTEASPQQTSSPVRPTFPILERKRKPIISYRAATIVSFVSYIRNFPQL